MAQTVSYEVRFALVIMFFLITGESLSLTIINMENGYWLKGLIFFSVAFKEPGTFLVDFKGPMQTWSGNLGNSIKGYENGLKGWEE